MKQKLKPAKKLTTIKGESVVHKYTNIDNVCWINPLYVSKKEIRQEHNDSVLQTYKLGKYKEKVNEASKQGHRSVSK
jgi:hypothetical protein